MSRYDYKIIDAASLKVVAQSTNTFFCRDYLIPEIGNFLHLKHKHREYQLEQEKSKDLVLEISIYPDYAEILPKAYVEAVFNLVNCTEICTLAYKQAKKVLTGEIPVLTMLHANTYFDSAILSFILFMFTRAKYMGVFQHFSEETTQENVFNALKKIITHMLQYKLPTDYFGSSPYAQTFFQCYAIHTFMERLFFNRGSSNLPSIHKPDVFFEEYQYGMGCVYAFTRYALLNPGHLFNFVKMYEVLPSMLEQANAMALIIPSIMHFKKQLNQL